MDETAFILRALPVTMLTSSQGLSYLNEKGGVAFETALASEIYVQGGGFRLITLDVSSECIFIGHSLHFSFAIFIMVLNYVINER